MACSFGKWMANILAKEMKNFTNIRYVKAFYICSHKYPNYDHRRTQRN